MTRRMPSPQNGHSYGLVRTTPIASGIIDSGCQAAFSRIRAKRCLKSESCPQAHLLQLIEADFAAIYKSLCGIIHAEDRYHRIGGNTGEALRQLQAPLSV